MIRFAAEADKESSESVLACREVVESPHGREPVPVAPLASAEEPALPLVAVLGLVVLYGWPVAVGLFLWWTRP